MAFWSHSWDQNAIRPCRGPWHSQLQDRNSVLRKVRDGSLWTNVNDGGGDLGAAGGADDDARLIGVGAVGDDRHHRRERPLARLDEIGRTGRDGEGAGDVGRREVVHFVVQYNARLLRGEIGPKTTAGQKRETSK